MKITSGYTKGLSLKTPKGIEVTRPTGEKVRQAVFNMLGPDRLIDATFVDLFAGSGAMGLEALSRQAKEAWFLECNKVPMGCLRVNASNLLQSFAKQDIEEPTIKFVEEDFAKWLDAGGLLRVFKKGHSCIVWGDPPYGESLKYLKQLMSFLEKSFKTNDDLNYFKDHVTLVWEWQKDKKQKEPLSFPGWELSVLKTYGETHVGFFEYVISTVDKS